MIEKYEEAGKYIELGEIPEQGKHTNIKMLDNLGLEIPTTIVVGQDYKVEDLRSSVGDLLEDGDKEIIIRSDLALGGGRNAPSIRDASKSIEGVLKTVEEFIQEYSNSEPTVIIQGLYNNSINSDILSANIRFRNTPIRKPPYYKYKYIPRITEIAVECTPDIAPLINRMNLTPPMLYKNGKFTIQESPLLWDMILYRVGREENKKRGEKIAKLEELPPNFNKDTKTQQIMSMGRLALNHKSDEYPGPSYWNDFWGEKLNAPPKEIKDLLAQEELRIENIVTKVSFPFNQGIFKMSFLYVGGEIKRYYWDIIESKVEFC